MALTDFLSDEPGNAPPGGGGRGGGGGVNWAAEMESLNSNFDGKLIAQHALIYSTEQFLRVRLKIILVFRINLLF